MPIIKNQFGGKATIRATANATFALHDFSLPYDRQTGNVAITGANVVGTGTSFLTNFSNGSYVHVVVNSTYAESRPINQVANATFMNVTTNWTSGNTDTTFYKAETVSGVEIASVTFTSNGSWTVARGANTLLVLHGTDNFDLYQKGQALQEFSGANINVSHSSAATGTLILEVSKRVSTSNNQVTIG